MTLTTRFQRALRRQRLRKWLPLAFAALLSFILTSALAAKTYGLPVWFWLIPFVILTLPIWLIFALVTWFAHRNDELRLHPAQYCPHCDARKGYDSVWCPFCGRGNCWRCGYNLFKNRSGTCPECGAPYCLACGESLLGETADRCPQCSEPVHRDRRKIVQCPADPPP